MAVVNAFCQEDWDTLRVMVQATDLPISPDGKEAARRAHVMLHSDTAPAPEDFDALMFCFLDISADALEAVARQGIDPMHLINAKGIPEFGITDEQASCCLCFLDALQQVHDKVCSDPECQRPRGYDFKTWIGASVENAKKVWDKEINR